MSKLKLNLSTEVTKEENSLKFKRIFSIENASNFSVQVSKDKRSTEIGFDDPNNYCMEEDAPVLQGEWQVVEQTENKIVLKEL